jgi:siroheme synthase
VPVAVVESATNLAERVTRGTLSSIAGIAAARNVKAPATIIVGNVVGCLNETTDPETQDHATLREE